MSYKISDAVAMRFIQIFQEAVLLGLDGADLMRQVRLVVDPEDDTSLTLDPQYVQLVSEMHKQFLDRADALSNEQKTSSLLLDS